MDNLFYELFLDIMINLPIEKRIEAILILLSKYD